MIDLSPVVAALFGSLYGSFLNVVIYRVPRGESVVSPRSRCPHCRKPIGAFDNLPVLSWFLLRGKSRCCRKPIAWRYPAVEAAVSALAAGLWLRWGWTPFFAAGTIIASGSLLAVALIDWDTFEIPDELSLGLAAAGVLISPLNPYLLVPGGSWWSGPLLALRGAACGFLMGWGVAAGGEAIFKKEAFGGGDVKLLAGIGAWTGFTGAFDSLMIGSTVGAVYGLALLRSGKVKAADPIPFGPFLAAGAVTGFFKLLPLGWPFI